MRAPSPARESAALEDARGELVVASAGLAAFLTGSEDIFLDVGRRVGGLADRARMLVSASSEVGPDPEKAGDAVHRLERELEHLEQHLRDTRETAGAGLEKLEQLRVRVEGLTQGRGDLEDVARTLRVLSTNVRIETARVTRRSAGLDAVSAEVRRLADLVDPRFKAVLDQAGRLEATVSAARDASRSILAEQAGWSRELLEDTRAALATLGNHAAAQGAVTSRAAATAALVQRDVDGVLVALLGHDATRQIIEHVIAELAAFEADAAHASHAPGLDAAAWLGEAAALGHLLAAQLAGGRERLVGALEAMASHLNDVALAVAGLTDEASRLAGLGYDSHLERVQASLGHAAGVLRRHAAHDLEMAAARRGVAGAVGAIVGHVRDLEAIAGAIKLLALNALVETARSGEGGRVLAVLARSLGGLADDVAQRTGEVSRTLQAVSELSAGLARAASAGGEADGAALALGLEALSERLAREHAALRAGIAEVHRGSLALREEVEAIAARIRQQVTAARALAQVEETLSRPAAARFVPPAAAAGLAGRRAGALRRYTMRSEREIHRRATGQPAALRPAQGERTGVALRQTQGERTAPAARAGACDLGDNVELF